MAVSFPDVIAVVPAAGIGSRMQMECPKQYLRIGQQTLLEHAVAGVLQHPCVKKVIIAISPTDRWFASLPLACHPQVDVVYGGEQRADSVLAGLNKADGAHWVLVHDAARPNLARTDLDRLLAELADDPVGGLLAVPARDTLKRADAQGRVAATIDRSTVWQAYTPQMFRLGALHRALADSLVADAVVTDEASAMEWSGQSPRLIEGRSDNIKVTRPEDLEWLRLRWANRL